MTDDSGRNPIDEYNARVSGCGGGSNTRFNLIVYSIMLMPVFIGVAYMYLHSGPPNPYVHPHIKADAYVWPVGCSEKDLLTKKIPFSCGNKTYLVDDIAGKYGILRRRVPGKGSSHFFRIDNDIYELECIDKSLFSSQTECDTVYIERDSYFQ